METLPPEILWKIFSPLCNDGGSFGKSLSLVSRYIHDASTRVRFQSVRCSGPKDVATLLASLNKIPPELRIIKHLYLYHPIPPSPPFLPLTHRQPAPSLSMRALALFTKTPSTHPPTPPRDLPKKKPFKEIQRETYKALLSLISIAAPHILTLSLYTEPITSWPDLPFPPLFPNLEELSIVHEFAGSCLRSDSFARLLKAPRLRRLIVMGYRRVTDPIRVAEKIREFAPSLEQICLPNYLTLNSTPLFEHLSEPWHNTHSEKYHTYPLRTIFLLDGAEHGPTSTCYITDGVKKVVWVRRKPWTEQLQREESMRSHWLARMRDEEGFWEYEGLGEEEEVIGDRKRWLKDIMW